MAFVTAEKKQEKIISGFQFLESLDNQINAVRKYGEHLAGIKKEFLPLLADEDMDNISEKLSEIRENFEVEKQQAEYARDHLLSLLKEINSCPDKTKIPEYLDNLLQRMEFDGGEEIRFVDIATIRR